jgi:uncharacterized protein YjiK
MRSIGPSLIAFLAGVAWLAISTTLIPASDGHTLQVAKSTELDRPCSSATMVARLPEVHEASGLTASRRSSDVLWTHNDSGEPVLYAVGTDGKLRGRVRVSGARVEDWEDIAIGPCATGSCLYIADIGDNREARAHVTIYRVPEPAPDAGVTAPAAAIQAAYPDQPQDAEGLFIGPNGALYIVTKGEGSPIAIYRVIESEPGSVARMQRVTTLSDKARKDQRITDADSTPDGQWVALRTLQSVEFHRTAALLAGKDDQALQVDLKKIGEPQGEGVAMLPEGSVYLAGEAGDGTRAGTLARLSCKLP